MNSLSLDGHDAQEALLTTTLVFGPIKSRDDGSHVLDVSSYLHLLVSLHPGGDYQPREQSYLQKISERLLAFSGYAVSCRR